MLYRETVAVCSEIHAKYINVLWAERIISEYTSCLYIKYVLGFKRLTKTTSYWKTGIDSALRKVLRIKSKPCQTADNCQLAMLQRKNLAKHVQNVEQHRLIT
jgi:hypothetical protein